MVITFQYIQVTNAIKILLIFYSIFTVSCVRKNNTVTEPLHVYYFYKKNVSKKDSPFLVFRKKFLNKIFKQETFKFKMKQSLRIIQK